jgi:hypothetical protein
VGERIREGGQRTQVFVKVSPYRSVPIGLSPEQTEQPLNQTAWIGLEGSGSEIAIEDQRISITPVAPLRDSGKPLSELQTLAGRPR